MFGLGAPEIIMILVIALLVLGPKRLPDAARSLGRGLGEFRRASSELRNAITSPMEDLHRDPPAPPAPPPAVPASSSAPGVAEPATPPASAEGTDASAVETAAAKKKPEPAASGAPSDDD